jgi:hypothetical protein
MPPKRASISLPKTCLKDVDKAELWLTKEEVKMVRSEIKRLSAFSFGIWKMQPGQNHVKTCRCARNKQ